MIDKLGPYELNQIYCGECAAMMEGLPDGCIDMWLTSPPYGKMRQYNGYTFDFERIAAQLWRVTKPGGVGVWVVGDETKDGSESGTSFRQALGFMAMGFNLHDTMIYERYGPPSVDILQNRYYQSFEFMFIFSKGMPLICNHIKEPKVYQDNRTQKAGQRLPDGTFSIRSVYRTEDKVKGNIWRYSVGGGHTAADNLATDHPAPFPEALARDHIISWSNPGDLVFDPMSGSGTTLKMAHVLGRRWLGFDISQEYVDLANRRVGEVIREQNKEWKPLTDNGHKLDDLPLFEAMERAG